MLSIFDIFKIGVGPSSSHTNGPMIAGYRFVQQLLPQLDKVARIQIDLYGSLSLTGKGHHTDRATLLGLMGTSPQPSISVNLIKYCVRRYKPESFA